MHRSINKAVASRNGRHSAVLALALVVATRGAAAQVLPVAPAVDPDGFLTGRAGNGLVWYYAPRARRENSHLSLVAASGTMDEMPGEAGWAGLLTRIAAVKLEETLSLDASGWRIELCEAGLDRSTFTIGHHFDFADPAVGLRLLSATILDAHLDSESIAAAAEGYPTLDPATPIALDAFRNRCFAADRLAIALNSRTIDWIKFSESVEKVLGSLSAAKVSAPLRKIPDILGPRLTLAGSKYYGLSSFVVPLARPTLASAAGAATGPSPETNGRALLFAKLIEQRMHLRAFAELLNDTHPPGRPALGLLDFECLVSAPEDGGLALSFKIGFISGMERETFALILAILSSLKNRPPSAQELERAQMAVLYGWGGLKNGDRRFEHPEFDLAAMTSNFLYGSPLINLSEEYRRARAAILDMKPGDGEDSPFDATRMVAELGECAEMEEALLADFASMLSAAPANREILSEAEHFVVTVIDNR